MSSSCLLCGGVRHSRIFNELGIDILRCRECRHMFSSFPANPHYSEFWGDEVLQEDHHYWNRRRSRMHRDFIERFIAPGGGRLLDMGCGLGFFLKALAPYSRWETHGCEISSAAVRYAHQTLGLSRVVQTRLDEAQFSPEYFDLITMWDVLEHVPRPDPVLRRCDTMLRNGGICFIRTPNAAVQLFRARMKKLILGMRSDSGYLMARDHLHHYSMKSIRRLLERNGFSRIEFIHLHPIGSADALGQIAKSVCFNVVRAFAFATGDRLNFDNLFVVARKNSRTAA